MPIERLICSYGEEACEITASYIALREHIKPYVLSAPLDRIPLFLRDGTALPIDPADGRAE